MLHYDREPFDAPSTFVTGVGTDVHEKVQAAIAKRFPDAQFEVPSQVVTSSGHCDAIIPDTALGKVLYELKTMGGFGYKKSIGFTNGGIKEPQGPRFSTILQSALNAKANGCDTIVVGHIGLEAISRGLAGRHGLSESHRFIAEWVIPKEVWEPLADAEMTRQLGIIDDVNSGVLPDRYAIDDDGREIGLTPENKTQPWQCQYCSYQEQCVSDGPGNVPVQIGDKNE